MCLYSVVGYPECVSIRCFFLLVYQWNNSKKLTAAAAKLLQSCPTLCNPVDGSLPGSSVLGILQARTLEWVAVSFSNAWKWSRSVVSGSPWFHGLQPRLLRPWEFPGKSTWVGCHCVLQKSWQILLKISHILKNVFSGPKFKKQWWKKYMHTNVIAALFTIASAWKQSVYQ